MGGASGGKCSRGSLVWDWDQGMCHFTVLRDSTLCENAL